MNFPEKKVMPRYFLVVIVLALLAVSVVAKAVYIMTAERERWISMSTINVLSGRTLPAQRGNILATDGRVLAASLPEYYISLDFMSHEKDTAWSNNDRYLSDTTFYPSINLFCAEVKRLHPDVNLMALRSQLREDWRTKDQYRRDTVLMRHLDDICQGLHRIFPDIDPQAMRRHLVEGRLKRSHYWRVYTAAVTSLPLRKGANRRVSYVEYSRVRKLPLFNLRSSANYEKVDMRRRPYGELANRTIGDFRDTARFGLELTFDSVLRGRDGKFHLEKVMNRRVVQVDTPAIDGCDVMTTIDIDIQELAENALRDQLTQLEAKSGVVVVMEVATGDIKAMTGLSRREDGSYHEDTALPVTDIYEPGSVFKPMSFLVAFDDGRLTMDQTIDTGGGIYRFGGAVMRDDNWRAGGSGVLTVPEVIQKSSNVGVSVLIDRAYGDDPAAFVEGLDRIGVREDLQIPLPGYQKPRIRRPGEGAYWSRLSLPWMSIGYESQNVPINTLNFYNGIANNGRLLRPRLVKAILRNGQVVREYPVTVLREQMAKPEAVRNVQQCLERVVKLGTGKKGASRYFTAAAKTGTAQVWGGGGKTRDYFVSYVGYFPADKPLYSCIVCIRKSAPAYGGSMCGPVFKRVSESIMARSHVADYTQARDTLSYKKPVAMAGNMTSTAHLLEGLGVPFGGTRPAAGSVSPAWGQTSGTAEQLVLHASTEADVAMPDLSGYGLRDAMARLERMGLSVKASGWGRVRRQSVAPGHAVTPGDTVRIELSE